MKPSLLLIAGWAHPAVSLEPLADLVCDLYETRTIAASDFDPRAALPSSVHLLGWSLGGMLALEAAAAQPDRVAGIILINTTARFLLSTGWLHGLPPAELRALGRALRHDLATGIHGFLQQSARLRRAPAGTPRSHIPVPLSGLEPLAAGLRYLEQADLRPLLPGIPTPALVVHAREDAVIPLGAGEALAATLPRARLVVCEDIGHDLPVRSPGTVAAAVREFYASCASTS